MISEAVDVENVTFMVTESPAATGLGETVAEMLCATIAVCKAKPEKKERITFFIKNKIKD
jgi:hypothetical protein